VGNMAKTRKEGNSLLAPLCLFGHRQPLSWSQKHFSNIFISHWADICLGWEILKLGLSMCVHVTFHYRIITEKLCSDFVYVWFIWSLSGLRQWPLLFLVTSDRYIYGSCIWHPSWMRKLISDIHTIMKFEF
jgi:hypothetical protein